MHERDFHAGYKGQPGDPNPLHANWEARAYSEDCHTVLQEKLTNGIFWVTKVCGRRRYFIGYVYVCPVCDSMDLWPEAK